MRSLGETQPAPKLIHLWTSAAGKKKNHKTVMSKLCLKLVRLSVTSNIPVEKLTLIAGVTLPVKRKRVVAVRLWFVLQSQHASLKN